MDLLQILFTAAVAAAAAGGVNLAGEMLTEPPAYIEPAQRSAAQAEQSVQTLQQGDVKDMKGNNKLAYSLNALMPADKNYMFSPLSIKMALALAANGADGETRTQILNAAGIDDLDKYNTYAQNLISAYAAISGDGSQKSDKYDAYGEKHEKTQLSIANSVWLNKDEAAARGGIAFADSYINAMRGFYNADASEVSYADAVNKINTWCSSKTNGRIPSVIDSPEFLAALVNAVYFKAEWAHQFEEYATHKDAFTDRNGKAQTVDFMSQTEYFNYYEDDDIQIVKMPYSGGGAAMYVVLSGDKRVDITPYIPKMSGMDVHIKMPKFKIEYSETINGMLNKIGIEKAFIGSQADFTKMLKGGANEFFISKVLHKTYIDVDENGTEAAAVTAIMLDTCAAEPEELVIKEFIADRPFGYYIIDENTSEILFMGEYAFAE